MPRALLSVYNKANIIPFAKSLVELDYEIISTGGTFKALVDAHVTATQVASITQFPEMLAGRVKTLHPHVHAGILAKRDKKQLAELELHKITPIDLVVVNLYPFREIIADPAVLLETALENIDVGGPTMIRAAAKNFPNVVVVVDPEDYREVTEGLKSELSLETRRKLATKAFAHVAAYDAAITRYLAVDELPDETALEINKITHLRYGENPHQKGSLWRLGNEKGPVMDAEVMQGKAMSFNNYQDADAAWNLLADLGNEPAVVAVKHTNPCGVAVADDALKAYELAHTADPMSIFGGIVATNKTIDETLAKQMGKTFLEIILAPEFTPKALEIFAKKKNLRLLKVQSTDSGGLDIRRIRGGLLIQEFNNSILAGKPKVVTKRSPTEQEWHDIRFAWTICKHTKSNAIVLAKDKVTIGIGVGQVSRIWAAEQAIEHAGDKVKGSALASDAFFPFDDVVRLAAKTGVTSVISPGGSKRDSEVIAACDEFGLTMVFTGMRHFRH